MDKFDVRFQARPWGDGSSEDGLTNIVCDEWEIVVVGDLPEDTANEIVARWNGTVSELAAKEARIKELEEAINDIARQKKTDELETLYDVEVADFEQGYDDCIDVARKAQLQAEKERQDG